MIDKATPTFPVWLREQRHRTDAVGDLAVAVLADLGRGELRRVPASIGALAEYIRSCTASDGVRRWDMFDALGSTRLAGAEYAVVQARAVLSSAATARPVFSGRDPLPTARVISIVPDRGVWTVTALCPGGRVVVHGGGSTAQAPVLGHRAAHCPRGDEPQRRHRPRPGDLPPCDHGSGYVLTASTQESHA